MRNGAPGHHERKAVQCPRCKGTDVRVVGELVRTHSGLSAVAVECACGKAWESKATALVVPLELEKMRSSPPISKVAIERLAERFARDDAKRGAR